MLCYKDKAFCIHICYTQRTSLNREDRHSQSSNITSHQDCVKVHRRQGDEKHGQYD